MKSIDKARDKVLVEVLKVLCDNLLGYTLLYEALHKAKFTSSFYDMERDAELGQEWCRVFIKWITDMREAK